MGKTRDTKGIFCAKMGTIKDRNGMGLTEAEDIKKRWKEYTELYKKDHELLIANFRLKLKKVGKTTRPFRYDLNQIPYDYTVGLRNRFKGLDLIECVMNYGLRFMTLYRRHGSRPSPWKRNAKKQNGCLRRPYK